MTQFKGLFTATLTPFDAVGRVDYGVVREHTEFLVQGGVNGVSPVGTTGEFLYLSTGEKVRIVEETVTAAKGRVHVMAGVWGLTPNETALLATAAENAGASAVFLPPPIYYPANDGVIFAHYAAVHKATTLPIFAYNIPTYAGNTVSLDCLERLATEGVIEGTKDSSGKAERMQALVKQFGGRMAVMAASDSFATEGRKIGADGFISAIANVWPKSFARLWAGEESLQQSVDAIRNAIKQHGGIPANKYLASLRGFAFGGSRLPFTALTDEQKNALREAFDRAAEAGLE